MSLWCTGRVIGTAESWRERAAAVRADGTAAIADAAVARWFTPAFALAHPAVVAGWRREIAAVPAPGYAGCCDALAAVGPHRPACRPITAPTLVVAGGEDPATPATALAELARADRSRARLEVLAPASHLAPLEQPGAAADLLLDHLG